MTFSVSNRHVQTLRLSAIGTSVWLMLSLLTPPALAQGTCPCFDEATVSSICGGTGKTPENYTGWDGWGIICGSVVAGYNGDLFCESSRSGDHKVTRHISRDQALDCIMLLHKEQYRERLKGL